MKQILTNIEKIKQQLLTLPPPNTNKNVHKIDVVKQLAPCLNKLLKKKYTYSQLQIILQEYGFNISVNTLSQYMQLYNKKIKKRSTTHKETKKRDTTLSSKKSTKKQTPPAPTLPISRLVPQISNSNSSSGFIVFEDTKDI